MTSYTLISPPPVYNDLNHHNWTQYHSSVYESINQVVPTLESGQNDRFPVITSTSMTTAERDGLKNVINGAIIYNETTNLFNFYENGAWVTK